MGTKVDTTFNLAPLYVNIPNSVSHSSPFLIRLDIFYSLFIQQMVESLLHVRHFWQESALALSYHTLTGSWSIPLFHWLWLLKSNLNKVLWELKRGSISARSMLGKASHGHWLLKLVWDFARHIRSRGTSMYGVALWDLNIVTLAEAHSVWGWGNSQGLLYYSFQST